MIELILLAYLTIVQQEPTYIPPAATVRKITETYIESNFSVIKDKIKKNVCRDIKNACLKGKYSVYVFTEDYGKYDPYSQIIEELIRIGYTVTRREGYYILISWEKR